MKIIYLTTSMDETDYKAFATEWSISLNPSKQIFHNKMINVLSKNNYVDVLSVRPFSRNLCNRYNLERSTNVQNNIFWHYLYIPRFKTFRGRSVKLQSYEIVKGLNLNEPTIIFVDTINPILVSAAFYLRKTFNIKVIGVCTDTPSNILGTNKPFSKLIFSYGRTFDGYIALTPGLNDIFNKYKKPSIVFEGVLNEDNVKKVDNAYGNYFLYAGSLLEKYGIYSLIKAFKQIERNDIKLLICGHHENLVKLNSLISDDERIILLGILPYRNVLQLEQNALACINPRPCSEDLNRFSMPSKLIEYLGSNSPTISVKNSILQNLFPEEVIWTPTNSVKDLKEAIEKVLNLSEEERNALAQKEKEKAYEMYSQSKIEQITQQFLGEFKK